MAISDIKPEFIKIPTYKLRKYLNNPNVSDEDKLQIRRLIESRLELIRETLPEFLNKTANKAIENGCK